LTVASISSKGGTRPGLFDSTHTRCQPNPDSTGPCHCPSLTGYLESDQRLSVCWLARRAPGRGILDLRRTLEQRVRLTKRPTNCTPIGKPDGVSDLRSIPGTYFPTIETSAANAHSQTMVAQPRSIELARRARLREYCRARLHCRGVSPPGLARRCQGRFR
jgi:hypothetical protein